MSEDTAGLVARVQSERLKGALLVLFATLILIASVILAVTLGQADITPLDVWHTIAHNIGWVAEPVLSPVREGIVWDLRLPRVLTAASVGAGLALCGTIMQALTRNPLADPYLLGLSSGASLGAVAVLMTGAALLLPVAAFLGAMAALLATLLLAGSLGSLTPSRMILAGVAISSLASACTSFLIFWNATGDSYRDILGWLMGSFGSVQWPQAGIVAAALGLVIVPVMTAARALDAFVFGDTAAAALGINVSLTRWCLLAGTAFLTGTMVSVGGAIGFVGLILPHAVRMVTQAGHRLSLPLSAVCGAVFMIWADTLARTAFVPRELPVGIVTAIVGAPVFIYILIRNRQAA